MDGPREQTPQRSHPWRPHLESNVATLRRPVAPGLRALCQTLKKGHIVPEIYKPDGHPTLVHISSSACEGTRWMPDVNFNPAPAQLKSNKIPEGAQLKDLP